MDRLRAIEYLIRVVETGSFSSAARSFDVSPPAVTKLIAALEAELGTPLLRRDSRNITLTPDGEEFFPVCVDALASLRAAEARLSVNRARVSGKLTVGVARAVGHRLMPFLADFLALHPDITIDFRAVQTPKEPAAAMVDILVYIGWLEDSDMVAKRIARTRFLTCAAPAYWRTHGRPNDPDELAGHPCLCFRTPWGVVLDLWKYQRDAEVRNVAVTSRMLSEDRAWTLDAALRGAGVVRVADLSAQPYIEQGLLEPVLTEWQALEAPNIYVMYRRTSRTSARVRAFVDFVTGVFATLEASGPQAGGSASGQGSTPAWFRTHWVGPLTRRPHS